MDQTIRLPLVSPATLGRVTFVKWDGQAKNQSCKCPPYNPPPPANWESGGQREQAAMKRSTATLTALERIDS